MNESAQASQPPLDLEKVLKGIMANPDFASPEEFEVRDIMPFLEALPTMVADLLDQPLTFLIMVQASLRFNQHLIQTKFADVIILQHRNYGSTQEGDTELALALNEALQAQIDEAKLIISMGDQYLVQKGMTEAQILLHERMELCIPLRVAYMLGQLTLRQLLENQPTVILFNLNH